MMADRRPPKPPRKRTVPRYVKPTAPRYTK